jgi:ATP-dependent Lhr-like helicase
MGFYGFSQETNAWFDKAFEEPTDLQLRTWQKLHEGRSVLVSAPTGSGKTLSGFLYFIDKIYSDIAREDSYRGRIRVLYVSPLKALAYDIEKNLRSPIVGIYREYQSRNRDVRMCRVGVRSGDTDTRARRDMLRNPPDILVTTPESLYLMLSFGARSTLGEIEAVIVDEVHALAPNKRGVHTALSLERLQQISSHKVELQRVGLSATQSPLSEVAKYLGGVGKGGYRDVCIISEDRRSEVDVEVVATKALDTLGVRGRSEVRSAYGSSGSTNGWTEITEELLKIVEHARTTLIFVNSRRQSEKLAQLMNEAYGEPVVRAHHGSLSKETRQEIENQLKAGVLRAVVATSSLELGIDVGSIEIVVQIEAPGSVNSALQRLGRANHRVGGVPKGIVIPKHPYDLLVSALTASAMQEGALEEIRVPTLALDVLAQHICSIVLAEGERGVDLASLRDVARGCYSYEKVDDEVMVATLEMLCGDGAFAAIPQVRPKLYRDSTSGRFYPLKSARSAVVLQPGVIADRGLFSVVSTDGTVVGSLDEEMAFETKAGDNFVLGASTWKVVKVQRDKVIVEPAPGQIGRTPYWKGDGPGRSYELGVRLAQFLRSYEISRDPLGEISRLPCDSQAARVLEEYLNLQLESDMGRFSTDREIVAELSANELGDDLCYLLSPFGTRVNSAWALAIEERVARLGGRTRVVASDDGLTFRVPDTLEIDVEDLLQLGGDDVEDLVTVGVANSPLLLNVFRECSARSLLIGARSYRGRTPLFQQRQRAEELLLAAKSIDNFPILVEAYREILADHFDLPHLTDLIERLRTKDLVLTVKRTKSPSPFSASMSFWYVANFIYDDSTPAKEARSAALGVDPNILKALFGSIDMRAMLSAEATEQVERELQRLDEVYLCRDEDDLDSLLRLAGDLSLDEIGDRCYEANVAKSLVDSLLRSGRASLIHINSEDRIISSSDAAVFRDAFGVSLPKDLNCSEMYDPDAALERVVRRYALCHGPFTAHQLERRYGVGEMSLLGVLSRLTDEGFLLEGEFLPGGLETEYVSASTLKRIRAVSLARNRRDTVAVSREVLPAYLAYLHGIVDRTESKSKLSVALGQLSGHLLIPERLESAVLPDRIPNYRPHLLDELFSEGEYVWLGVKASEGDPRVVFVPRELEGVAAQVLAKDLSSVNSERGRSDEIHLQEELLEVLTEDGPMYFSDIVRALGLKGDQFQALAKELWNLVFETKVTSDTLQALRGYVSSKPAKVTASPSSKRSGLGRVSLASLSVQNHLFPQKTRGLWRRVSAEVVSSERRSLFEIENLLSRVGFISKTVCESGGIQGGLQRIYKDLEVLEYRSLLVRGYFVEGLGGTQFFLKDSLELLRRVDESIRLGKAPNFAMATDDPVFPFGIFVPWSEALPSDSVFLRRLRRRSTAFVGFCNGLAKVYFDSANGALVALDSNNDSKQGVIERDFRDDLLGGLNEILRKMKERGLSVVYVRDYSDDFEKLLERLGAIPTPKGKMLRIDDCLGGLGGVRKGDLLGA